MAIVRKFATACIFLVVCGCGEKAKIPFGIYEELDKLPEDAVLIDVNGRKGTKADLNEIRRFRRAFYELVKKDKEAEQQNESNLNKLDGVAVSTFFGNFIRETLINQAIEAYVKKNGEFLASDLSAAEARVKAQYASTLATSRLTLEKLTGRLAEEGVDGYFSHTISNEFRQEVFLSTAFSNRYVITSNVVGRIYANIEDHNRLVVETNKTIAATYNAVLKALDAGGDFGELAEKYSMDSDRNPGGDMGECQERDFAEEPEIWKAVKGLSPGEHTRIVAASDSFQILKLLRKIPAAEARSHEDSLHLARIYFRRADQLPRYPEDEVRATLEQDRRKRIVTEIIEKGLLGASITFPSGDNLIPRESADFYINRANELKAEQAAKGAGDGAKPGEGAKQK